MKAHDEQWDQGDYFFTGTDSIFIIRGDSPVPDCGSRACLAGFVTYRASPKGSKMGKDATIIFPDGTTRNCHTWAAELLRVTPAQANCLFITCEEKHEVKAVLHYLMDNPRATVEQMLHVASLAPK